MTNLPDYEPEIVSYIRKDEGFLRACAKLAEVLDLLPSTVEDLAFDHDFIKACSRLSAVKVRLAVQFQRQQKES